MEANKKTLYILTGVGVAMLGLGFASDPLYDTFCRVTGYGGTTQQAQENLSEVIDRTVTVKFDSNVASGLPWVFKPDQREMDVKLGQSGLAYYTVKNESSVFFESDEDAQIATQTTGSNAENSLN